MTEPEREILAFIKLNQPIAKGTGLCLVGQVQSNDRPSVVKFQKSS